MKALPTDINLGMNFDVNVPKGRDLARRDLHLFIYAVSQNLYLILPLSACDAELNLWFSLLPPVPSFQQRGSCCFCATSFVHFG